MILRRTSLSHNIVAFCRFLRANGLGVGPDEEATALLALAQVDLADREGFRLALRTALCRQVRDLEPFDRLFAQYWKELETAVDAKTKDDPNKRQQQKPKPGPDFNQLKSWLYGNKPSEETEITTYSTLESVSRQDFSLVSADDLAEVMQRIRELSLTMARRANRRYRKTHAPRRFDLPRTLRKNLRRGGEILDIAYRKPRKNHLNVVVLADVSQSMSLYSTFLIQFLYAFQTVYRRIETFVFSTHLHRVTPALRNQPFGEALHELSANATGWGGGTRIGASLRQFTDEYLNLVDRHTVVIILSDGWDTGDVAVLAESLAHIKAKARKLVWLNPLAGNPAFRPTVSGMEAALPFLDGFAPVHNVESLRTLEKWL
ncbi:vWA domain-containing protein [Spirosoma montaniterrae]|uniref:VWA containing CoxE family protein n=1 Tax=Spirosoma montaniterrae TaxID=1178516 RepID=A0A1P9WUH9_9BACT|nr:VWA domain-containing protein [Spirosoma montaniterrae]AQG79045.1 VWA containing CoxE family protein [Spirosoma montaniterrae]